LVWWTRWRVRLLLALRGDEDEPVTQPELVVAVMVLGWLVCALWDRRRA
jgi:hypothetical protein